MLRTNETRHVKWYETCKRKCRMDASVCNNKQRWNNDKCWCQCKELIDKGVCDNIEEKLTEVTLFEHKNGCTCYYTVFIVLGEIVLIISIGISAHFAYYKYINRNKENVFKYDHVYHAKNY